MEKNLDDLYEILDDMIAHIEDIVDEHNNSEVFDQIIVTLHQRAQEFIYDFQQEVEQLELMKTEN